MAKKFGISKNAKDGLSQTINLAENNSEDFYSTFLPVHRVFADPNNPRKLHITADDIRQGIDSQDKLVDIKKEELENLASLSKSILSEGVIHPIICVKVDDHYQIVAGERRWLASILAKKENIPARVFHNKPREFHYKLVQFIENNERQDLSLFNKLMNIKTLLAAYQEEYPTIRLTTEKMGELLYLSNVQASRIFRVIQGDVRVLEAIKSGHINNLHKAIEINAMSNEADKQQALSLAMSGAGKQHVAPSASATKKRGRPATHVSLGKITKLSVVKLLIDSVTKEPRFHGFNTHLNTVVWTDPAQVKRVFKRFLRFLEESV